MIDTNDTAHYLIATFLAKLLKPLTTKEVFFMILLMLHGRLLMFLNNYLFVDISTHHSIWSHFLMYLYLRLLILSYLDTCTKTLVTFNNKFFELKDAVTMGSLLVPVFVNIIMRKLKKKSIKNL